MQTDPTHVPFHVSVALTSRADGTFCPVQLLIHQGMVRVSYVCVLFRSSQPTNVDVLATAAGWAWCAAGCWCGARRGGQRGG